MQQAQATQPQPTANQPPTQPGEPKEEDFVDYLDYFEAKVMHNLRKEMGAQSEQAKTAQEQQQQTAQYEQYVAQKMQQINTSVLEREKQSPGFQKAFQEAYEENAEILDYMPQRSSAFSLKQTTRLLRFQSREQRRNLLRLCK